MENKEKKQSFFMRNIYYFLIAFILLAAIVVTVVLAATDNGGLIDNVDKGGTVAERPSDNSSTIEKPDDDNDNHPQKEDKPVDKGNVDDKPNENPVDNTDDNQEDVKPTGKVSFIIPVDGATVITDYTATSVVYNKTLNVFTGHLAIDFSADAGSAVKAVYDGVVESVETSYLTGTTITIKHSDSLKTVYNSVEADENLTIGAKVEQGQTIGTVADNNKQEYKDGAHLHFEVFENDKKISPYKYLVLSEK